MDGYEKALVRYLESKGVDVPDGASVSLEQYTAYEGYCETCSWEEERARFKVDGITVYEERSDLPSMLRNLLAV